MPYNKLAIVYLNQIKEMKKEGNKRADDLFKNVKVLSTDFIVYCVCNIWHELLFFQTWTMYNGYI